MIVKIGTISAGYGVVSKIHPNGHTGIDYAVPLHTPLHAPYDGIVTAVRDYGNHSLGKAVFVQKEDGTLYVLGHLSDIKVKIGQKIQHGDLLGLSGSTGRSTGPHLHYGEFGTNGMPIDPGYVPFDSFQPVGLFERWTTEAMVSGIETFVDIVIMFLPEIVTIGFILLGFKLMLSPLWK